MRKEQYDYGSKDYDRAAIIEKEAVLKLMSLGFADMLSHDRLLAENTDELCTYIAVMEREATNYDYMVREYKYKYGEDEVCMMHLG